MIIELAIAALLTPAADLWEPGMPLQGSLKDSPGITRNSGRPEPRRKRVASGVVQAQPAPPTPNSNIFDRMDKGLQPYVVVEGFPGKRLAVTWDELRQYNLIYGQTVTVRQAAEIASDKLKRMQGP